MKELCLNKEDFKLFDQDDQFGFFYDEDGFPKQDANLMFDSDVNNLYEKYESIVIDTNDNIYGEQNGERELIMKEVYEAYYIAREVKEI